MWLLVVEDDEVIADRLRLALSKEGYQVDVALDGEEGLRRANQAPYAAIVLDLMLPKIDGWEVCRRIRASRNPVPILMLTAREQVGDRVKGLDLGADDYLPKPFDFVELAARIRALLRRDRVSKSAIVQVADLEIDTTHRTATRSGEALHLTPREFELLEALAANVGRTLSVETILDRIWGEEESGPNAVRFQIVSLRRKIDVGREQGLIETVHGVGYRMRVPSSEESA